MRAKPPFVLVKLAQNRAQSAGPSLTFICLQIESQLIRPFDHLLYWLGPSVMIRDSDPAIRNWPVCGFHRAGHDGIRRLTFGMLADQKDFFSFNRVFVSAIPRYQINREIVPCTYGTSCKDTVPLCREAKNRFSDTSLMPIMECCQPNNLQRLLNNYLWTHDRIRQESRKERNISHHDQEDEQDAQPRQRRPHNAHHRHARDAGGYE